MTYSEQVEMYRLQDKQEKMFLYGRQLNPSDNERLLHLENKFYSAQSTDDILD